MSKNVADNLHPSVEDDAFPKLLANEANRLKRSQTGRGAEFDSQLRPTLEATPGPDGRDSGSKGSQSDAVALAHPQLPSPIVEATESSLNQKGKQREKVTGINDAQSKPLSDILAEENLTSDDTITELSSSDPSVQARQALHDVFVQYQTNKSAENVPNKDLDSIQEAISIHDSGLENGNNSSDQTYDESKPASKTVWVNQSQRRNADYEEYYKRAEEPLARLSKNPSDIDALKRVRELNKMILNENKEYQREKKQGWIQIDQILELFQAALIKKQVMEGSTSNRAGKLAAQANIREYSEKMASIVREEGYPEIWILNLPNLDESFASADPAELIKSAHRGSNAQQRQVQNLDNGTSAQQLDHLAQVQDVTLTDVPRSPEISVSTQAQEASLAGAPPATRVEAETDDENDYTASNLVNGYTLQGEKIIAFRKLFGGKSGQYLIASGHQGCPLYQLVPPSYLTRLEIDGYNYCEHKQEIRGAPIKRNRLEFKKVKATAKAHNKSHRREVTFVLIELTTREFWTSRTAFRNWWGTRRADREIIQNEEKNSECRQAFYRNLGKPLPVPYERDNLKSRNRRISYDTASIHPHYSDGLLQLGLISSVVTPWSERLSQSNAPNPPHSRRQKIRTDFNPAADASNLTDTSLETQDSIKMRLLEEKLDALTKMMEQILAARA